MKHPEKILITGMMHTGSTLLVRILEELGYDIGGETEWLNPRENRSLLARSREAGYDPSPQVIKYPHQLKKKGIRSLIHFAQNNEWRIRGLIITTRRFPDLVKATYHPKYHKSSQDCEKLILARQGDLMQSIADSDYACGPVVFLNFPRYTRDPDYFYGRMRPVLDFLDIETIHNVLKKHVDASKVHYG